jgi:hypothetical protein
MIEPKVFYRITCDRCGVILTDGDSEWWDRESTEVWLEEADWLVIEPTQDHAWERHFFCPICRDFQPQPKDPTP